MSASDPLGTITRKLHEWGEFVAADVGQAGTLEPSPKALYGIQFRCISGEALDRQPVLLSVDPGPHIGRVMGRQPVPEQYDWTADVPAQVSKEAEYADCANRPALKQQEKASPAGITAIRDGANGRHPMQVTTSRMQDRRMATRSPCAPDYRCFRKARLIHEDQCREFFLAAAKSVSSKTESLLRHALWPASLASEVTSPARVVRATRVRGDIGFRFHAR